jgi:hypothetical protein
MVRESKPELNLCGADAKARDDGAKMHAKTVGMAIIHMLDRLFDGWELASYPEIATSSVVEYPNSTPSQ